MAEILPEEQAAAALTAASEAAKLPIPKLVTQAQATAFLAAAGGDPKGAREIAEGMEPPLIFMGVSGTEPAAPGRTADNPTTVRPSDSPNLRLGRTAVFEDAVGNFQPFVAGQFIEFSDNMSSDLGFAVPAGSYEMVTDEPSGTLIYRDTSTGDEFLAETPKFTTREEANSLTTRLRKRGVTGIG